MASSRPHPRAVPPILVAALVAVSSAAVLVVTGRFLAAGLLGAVAVGASILAGVWARDSAERRLVFADHAVERLVEAALFASIAWAWVPEEPWVAAAALCALVASYLASYLTAKATGLGFEVRERLPYRSVRPLLAVVGLLAPRVIGPALWAAAAISLEPVIRHGWSVVRQRESA